MAIVNGYSTLPEAKAWVGITDAYDDVVLEDIVTAVSRWIDNYCRRHFWKTAASTPRLFDTTHGHMLSFGFDDLVSVNTLATDDNGDGVYETTWAATDYQLLPIINAPEPRPYREIRAIAGRAFPTVYSGGRVGVVQVSGVWGWPAIPQPVDQACRMQTSRILQRRKSPEGVAGWGEFGPMRISGRLDPDVAQLLNAYRLPLVA